MIKLTKTNSYALYTFLGLCGLYSFFACVKSRLKWKNKTIIISLPAPFFIFRLQNIRKKYISVWPMHCVRGSIYCITLLNLTFTCSTTHKKVNVVPPTIILWGELTVDIIETTFVHYFFPTWLSLVGMFRCLNCPTSCVACDTYVILEINSTRKNPKILLQVLADIPLESIIIWMVV